MSISAIDVALPVAFALAFAFVHGVQLVALALVRARLKHLRAHVHQLLEILRGSEATHVSKAHGIVLAACLVVHVPVHDPVSLVDMLIQVLVRLPGPGKAQCHRFGL